MLSLWECTANSLHAAWIWFSFIMFIHIGLAVSLSSLGHSVLLFSLFKGHKLRRLWEPDESQKPMKWAGRGPWCELKRVNPVTADNSPVLSDWFLICFSVEAKNLDLHICIPPYVWGLILKRLTNHYGVKKPHLFPRSSPQAPSMQLEFWVTWKVLWCDCWNVCPLRSLNQKLIWIWNSILLIPISGIKGWQLCFTCVLLFFIQISKDFLFSISNLLSSER